MKRVDHAEAFPILRDVSGLLVRFTLGGLAGLLPVGTAARQVKYTAPLEMEVVLDEKDALLAIVESDDLHAVPHRDMVDQINRLYDQ